uniref:PDZ and pleckstrin homology domains 1 n=1 Tax=Tetraodon nigroviridis TaxID=99883 RepID=H3C194_TETNG
GEYPWGFRIQFSKPIVVTEVDTNGAAEEAGLMVGDYLLAVNGTDVTSIPHSEAANLARLGPDLLTLTIGSDIARYPSSPRPACRGYLYKRTQSGLIKGWRKRWFVLTHDCCLCYYRHRRDEGKQRPLLAVRLEGAEVRADASLGKPFVFRCCPQAVSRVFFFCANSRQEMKRWLEAMEKAIRPVTQNHVWEDVTRHNCSLPPLAVKHPERLGLLHKLDTSRDAWVQHYCILKDGCLSFYSGIRATHAQAGSAATGF